MKKYEEWNSLPKETFREKIASFINRHLGVILLILAPGTVGALAFYWFFEYPLDLLMTVIVHGLVYLELAMIHYGYIPGKIPLLVPLILYAVSMLYTVAVVLITLLLEIGILELTPAYILLCI